MKGKTNNLNSNSKTMPRPINNTNNLTRTAYGGYK